MKTFVIEITWLPGGISHGWGCGYIGIPKGHPLYGVTHDNIDVDVHGALTFSSHSKKCGFLDEADRDADLWIVGFDTAHYNDSQANWPKEAVEAETRRLAELKNIIGIEKRKKGGKPWKRGDYQGFRLDGVVKPVLRKEGFGKAV